MGSLLGKPKTQKSTSTTTVDMPEWLEGPQKSIVDQTMELSQTPYEAYSGQRLAAMSPDEMSAFDITRGMIGQATPQMQQSQGIANQIAQRGLSGFSQAELNQWMNPYTENVLDVSKRRQLEQFDLAKRNMQQAQGQRAAFGGSRSGLESAQMYGDFAQQLADSETLGLSNAYESGMNRAFQGSQMAGAAGMDAANLAQQGQRSSLTDAAALEGIGAKQRTQEQMGLDIGYQDFLTEKAYPYEQLQFASGIVNPVASMNAGQTNTQTTKQSGGSGLLGAALGLGSMFMGIPGVGTALSGLGGSMLGGMGAGLSTVSSLSNMLGGQSGAAMFNASGMYGPYSNQYFKEGGLVGYKEGGRLAAKGSRYEELLASLSDQAPKESMGDYLVRAIMEQHGPLDQGLNAVEAPSPLPVTNSGPRGINLPTWQGNDPRGDMTEAELEMLLEAIQGTTSDQDEWRSMQGHPEFLQFQNGGRIPAFAEGGLASRLVNEPYAGPMTDLEQGLRYYLMQREAGRYQPKPGANLLKRGLGAAANIGREAVDLPVRAVHGALAGTELGLRELTKPRYPEKENARGLYDQQQADLEAGLAARKDKAPNKLQAQAAKALGKSPLGEAVNSGTPATKATAVDKGAKKDDWNWPLIAFGAALLGSEGDFFQGLGEGAKAFATTKLTREEAVRQAAKDEAELLLANRKTDLYSKQVDAQMLAAQAKGSGNSYSNKLAFEQAKGQNATVERMAQELLKSQLASDPDIANDPVKLQEAVKRSRQGAMSYAMQNNMQLQGADEDATDLGALTDDELFQYASEVE